MYEYEYVYVFEFETHFPFLKNEKHNEVQKLWVLATVRNVISQVALMRLLSTECACFSPAKF